MKKKLSILTSALVLSSSAVYAESNSISEAFEKGKVTGDISAHYQNWDNGSGNTDSGFSTPSMGLNFETDSVNGFSATVGFRANTETSEEESGDYAAEMADNASLTQAFVKYENDSIAISAGRQEIDLEWLVDYNDAIVAVLKTIPNTTVTAGWTKRKAEIGADIHEKFEKVNNDKGAYVLDAKYEGIENIVLNPYYYSANDVANFYGLKADFDTDTFGATAHYATSSEKAAGQKDGSIMHFEARTAVSDLELAAGYIKTDKDAGVGSISAFGDNIDPSEELGDSIYAADSKTFYATAGYTISEVELSALYAQADFANNKDRELTFAAGYAFTDAVSAEIIYTDLSLDSDVDKSKLVANVVYEF